MLACSLFLSACSTGETSTENSTENGEESAAAALPRAGLYKVTDTSEIIGSTSVPTAAVAPQTSEICQPDQSEEDLLVAIGMNCTNEQVRIEDGEISAKLICTAPGTDIRDATLDIRGSYDANGADTTGDLIFPQGMIRLTRKMERVGDC
jgi:hypothetical protein